MRLFIILIIILFSNNCYSATYYAVNAGGNWGTATTWSTISNKDATRVGDAPNAPLTTDDVVIDDYSGSLTINTASNCLSADFTGHTGTLTHNANQSLNIYGNLTMVSGMTYNPAFYYCYFNFPATSGTWTINTANKPFGRTTFGSTGAGSTAVWTLGSDFSNRSADSSSNVILAGGTLSTSGTNYAMNIGGFSKNSNYSKTLTLNSSTVTCLGSWDASTGSGAITITAGTYLIVMSGDNVTFAGGGKTYNDISISSGGAIGITFTGSNTFDDFTINSPKIVKFTKSTTTTVSTFSATGTVGNNITLNSDDGSTQFTILKSGGGTSINDYLDVNNSIGNPENTFFYGVNGSGTNVTNWSSGIYNSQLILVSG